MADRSLLICATEMSGDARGARVARELRSLVAGLRIYGLGGERMRRAGVDVRVDITDRGTVGWFDHWAHLPCYLSALRFWRHEVRRHRPTVAMVIDAPGLSFPFARLARAAGVPVIYFVTPQTWLWNPAGAVERLRTHADVVVPSLAAEAALYQRAGLPVVYEGHPALDDLLDTYGDRPTDVPRTLASDVTIAVVPGSRRHAIRRLLPVMLDALEIAKGRVAVGKTVVSIAGPALRPDVQACLRRRPNGVEVMEGDLCAVLRRSDIALASTGGNLLEATFAGVPAVACYRVDPLTYVGAKHLLRLDRRVPAYALPNLIAGEPVMPALIQKQATAARLAEAVVRLVTDGHARSEMRAGYGKVRQAIGTPGVNARIARRLIPLVDPGCRVPSLDPGSGRPERSRRAPLRRP